MERKVLRIVYTAEFLLALIAVYAAWSQIGGQGHLDLMAWHLKLLLGLAMAYAIVRATASAAADERAWNGKTLRWMGLLVLFAMAAGMATYYYHLYEPSDEQEDPPTTQSWQHMPGRGPEYEFQPVILDSPCSILLKKESIKPFTSTFRRATASI